MDGYSLTRQWFNFASDNYKCKSIHTALYLWIVEKNNRLMWKKEFGLPSADTMEVLSIGNKRTYLSALNDLKDWGFIKIVHEAKNQYQSCIISICHVKNDTANKSAVAKLPKHCPSIDAGTAPIVKPLNDLKEKTKKGVYEKKNLADNVLVTEEEHSKLIELLGDNLMRLVNDVSNYKIKSGKKYASDFQAIVEFHERQKSKPPTIRQFVTTGPQSKL